MSDVLLASVMIAFILLVYHLMRKLYARFSIPFLLPIVTGTTVIVVILLVFNIPYTTFMLGGEWIEFFLGPAVVALAYPLYMQRAMLKKYFLAIMSGVLVGAVIGIVSGLQLAKWLGVESMLAYSLVPKSVTTPVAMDVAKTIGGIPPLAAIFVMVAGIGGVVVAPYIFKLFRIDHFVGKGVGTGAASHAIGTTKALENSEEEGAASSVAMTLSAIVVSIIGPLLVFLIS